MNDSRMSGPVETLREAVAAAFPDRSLAIELKFDGSLMQAWAAFARLVALTPVEMAKGIASQYGVQAAGSLDNCEHDVLAQIPSSFCQQHNVLPLRFESGCMVMATANPLDDSVTERARFLAGRPITWVLAPPQEIEDAVVFAYAKEATQQAGQVRLGTEDVDSGETSRNPVVKLARGLMSESVRQRASDLHIQPYLGAFIARIRVDGVLRRLTMLPDAVAASLIRHIKTRAGMDAANSLIPQDGRLGLVIDNREFDLRVSSLPASRGERLVMRFLDQGRVHRLSSANFSHASLQIMRRAITRPSGLVLMTGPTGSGKTSTLYGMLAELNRSSVNIITVENPIEYRIPGISQVEVNEKAGRTFMVALRSILRQDPDAVLIGEIRDKETAEIACQAALTGHLVLSTLHTNDALTAIPRLLNLDVQPTILADSLAMVIAQRLCRMLCVHCKVPVTAPLTPEEQTFLEVTHNRPGHRAVGCKQCDYTGFHGRLPIVDIVEMNKGLRDAVALGESRLSELDKLRDGGLRSLAASGSLRIISGDTTVAEVSDAVGPAFWPELADHYGAVCFSDALDLAPRHVAAGQSVLLINPQPGLVEPLARALEQEGLLLTVAQDAEMAHELLKKDEDIAFIIGEVPEGASLDVAVEQLQHNRLHISWARLPALVLVPEALMSEEAALRASGVMGSLLAKPADATAIVKHIRQARAR